MIKFYNSCYESKLQSKLTPISTFNTVLDMNILSYKLIQLKIRYLFSVSFINQKIISKYLKSKRVKEIKNSEWCLWY